MKIVTFSVSELRNMKFPTQWAKQNKGKIQNIYFSNKYSLPIIANIDGRKIPHIISEFEFVAHLFLAENNAITVTCLLYDEPALSKEAVFDIFKAQEHINSGIAQIRIEMELLTDEEKTLMRFQSAFDVEKDNYFKEINRKYEGEFRRINEKSLHIAYEKNQMQGLFAPMNLSLEQQAEILSEYTKSWMEIIEIKDERLRPRISLIRYLWSIYPAIFELMINHQINFKSAEYKETLVEIFDTIIVGDVEKLLLTSTNAEKTISSAANRHSKAIKKLMKPVLFNPFGN